MLLYNRTHVKFRNDGYCWKKRKDGRTTREDHMKLKVQGVECIYGKYFHSAILPTFHKRCYWLLHNPDIVLVHYLNVPYSDDNKLSMASLPILGKSHYWTHAELQAQLRPMFYSVHFRRSDQASPSKSEQVLQMEETVESIVQQLLEQQEQRLQQQQQHQMAAAAAHKQQADDLEKSRNQKTTNTVTVLPQGATIGGSSVLAVSSVQTSSSGGQSLTAATPGTAAAGLAGTPVILNLQNGNGLLIFSGQTIQIPMTTTTSMAANHSTPHHQQQQSVSPSIGNDMKLQRDVENTVVNNGRQQSAFINHRTIETSDTRAYSSAMDVYNDNNKQTPVTCDSPPKTDSFMDLQLTHDDIQDALSASLPEITSSNHSIANMDGLESSAPSGAVTTNASNIGDLNIDAFDYFLDLEDLDAIEPDLLPTATDNNDHAGQQTHLSDSDKKNQAGIANITDYSPDWSYPEGGTKVLITGPWYSTTSPYTCVFDGVSVPATLVQSGVLRCVCPAHAPGIVTFQVACEGYVISNACSFEYRIHERTKPSADKKAWVISDDKEFKLALLDKLSEIEKCLVKPNSSTNSQISKPLTTMIDAFEQHCIDYCVECSLRAWLPLSQLPISSSDYKGMTLLHLAAALGYSHLIQTLIKWRNERPSIVLEYEVDALSLDNNSSTPFAWACGLNKIETSVVLYRWNQSAVNVCSSDGMMPLTLASNYGNRALIERIQKLRTSIENSSRDVFREPTAFGFSKYTNSSPPPSFSGLTSSRTTVEVAATTKGKNSSSSAAKSKRAERLRKRLSVEIFPSVSKTTADPTSTGRNLDEPMSASLRSANSDPHLTASLDAMTSRDNPMFSSSNMGGANDFGGLPITFMQTECQQLASKDTEPKHSAMDTDRSESPFIDVERISSDEDDLKSRRGAGESSAAGDHKNQMVTLAKQIIAAMPERIKLSPSRSDDSGIVRDRSSSYGSLVSNCEISQSVCTDESAMSAPLGGADSLAFDEYRYSADIGTPASSLSPDSSCLQSPLSFLLDSPPPTMSEFQEYFNAPSTYMEKDFSQLTLSDHEQRRLYEAAKIIQNFYRQYKDRQQQQNQRIKEIEAAILIQSYYRRYKQYAYYKKMCQAAVLIQSQFRSYQVQKKYKRSRDAATVIQNQYRAYKEHERFKKSRDAAKIIQQRFRYRSHYQRKQGGGQDVSRSMQNLMRQSVDSYYNFGLYSMMRPEIWESTENEANENDCNDKAVTPVSDQQTPLAPVSDRQTLSAPVSDRQTPEQTQPDAEQTVSESPQSESGEITDEIPGNN
ncbi:calmodulin-binding transcription activator 2-like [Tubulanus polymorphus]|uniref:calmodulin-binding transcription activator 2-like n=1 Tax=Tubulanus polymorphus TaxID=672921 RepID=UPI003DA64B30